MKKTIAPIPIKFIDLISSNGVHELYINTSLKKEASAGPSVIGRTDFFSICLVADGDVNFVFNFDEQRELHKNDLLVLSPSTVLQCIPKSESTSTHIIAFTSRFLTQLGISKNEMEMIYFLVNIHPTIISLGREESEYMVHLIEDLEKKNFLNNEHPYAENILIHSFQIFLLEIAAIGRKYKINNVRPASRKQDIVFRFGDLVNGLFRKERSVKYYADQLSITPKYLSELVHEVTGRTASDLIDEKVIQELKYLLATHPLTVSQIADSFNFPNQSTMGKFFRRHTGMSPVHYRNGMMKSDI